MYTTVEGKGEKHRSHVLASGTGGTSWQVMAGPTAGMPGLWGAIGAAGGVSIGVRASLFQPEWGGKDSRGTKPCWSGAMQPASRMQQCPLGSIPLICLWASQLLWILFGGWLYATGVRTWLSSIYQHVHVSRLCAGGIWQCCQGWSRVVAVDTHLVPSQVTQSEKIKGCKCSCSVSAKGELGVIYLFIDQSNIVLNSLSFWSVLGESTYITTFSHITAIITLTALKTAPHLAVLFRRTHRLVLGEDLAETPEYQALATKQHWNPAAARSFCRQPVGKSMALE